MIKRMSLKKLLVCFLALFSLGIMHFIPNKELKPIQEVEYIEENTNNSFVYLEDKDNYLVRVNTTYYNDNIEDKARELLTKLINHRTYKNFKSIIPKNTKINSIKYSNNVLKVDFSKDLLNVKKEKEEKVIESIIYTLTEIKDINYIIIYIDGEILSQLPKSKITLPATLSRNYGINKEYNLTSDKNISKTTIYYIKTYNDREYYVPVTKINNDSRDKIEIIIDELSNNHINNKLMSYMNDNTKLVSSNIENDSIILNFNESIINDIDEQNILEEVIYTICLSIGDNYNVNTVYFNINNKEINKTTLKSLE